jgi:hypothetical protein
VVLIENKHQFVENMIYISASFGFIKLHEFPLCMSKSNGIKLKPHHYLEIVYPGFPTSLEETQTLK